MTRQLFVDDIKVQHNEPEGATSSCTSSASPASDIFYMDMTKQEDVSRTQEIYQGNKEQVGRGKDGRTKEIEGMITNTKNVRKATWKCVCVHMCMYVHVCVCMCECVCVYMEEFN